MQTKTANRPCLAALNVESLPPDVQLAVIDYLDSRDILCLQMTCKHFNSILEDYGEPIWRRCLMRQCVRNGLFKPSFKDLTGATELKRACTDALYLRKLCDEAAAQRKPINPRSIKLHFPRDDNPIFEDTILVPGGRFLVTSEKNGNISLWDLAGIQDTGASPTLLAHERLEGFDLMSSASYHNESSAIYVLTVGFRGEVPASYAPPLGSTMDLDDLEVDELTVTAFVFLKDEDRFISRRMGVLPLVQPDDQDIERNFYIEGDRVVAQLIGDSATILWDFVPNMISVWRHETSRGEQVFTTSTTTFIINDQCLQAYEHPEFVPLGAGGYIDVADICNPQRRPMDAHFTLLHEEMPQEQGPLAALIVCPESRSVLEANEPVFYDVVISEPEQYVAHRYSFTFKSDLQGYESKLKRVGIARYARHASDLRPLEPYVLLTCEDDLWMLWGDESDHTVAISYSPATNRVAGKAVAAKDSSSGSSSEDEGPLPVVADRRPTPFIVGRMDISLDIGCQFDPWSRKAVVLCENEEMGSWVELFLF